MQNFSYQNFLVQKQFFISYNSKHKYRSNSIRYNKNNNNKKYDTKYT